MCHGGDFPVLKWTKVSGYNDCDNCDEFALQKSQYHLSLMCIESLICHIRICKLNFKNNDIIYIFCDHRSGKLHTMARHTSPPFNNYATKLTVYVLITSKDPPVWGLFHRLDQSETHKCSGGL